ncbi:uncharacterized protein [Rhodnius prolixus]|uniref:Putative thioredoxin n=1 Tax=Rhodnius prolixus TaxID=13249 RepID=R4FKJ3_RHOPR
MPTEIRSLTELESKINDAGEKLIVLYFGAIWCKPCRVAAPKITELEKEYPDLMILKIDVDGADEITFLFGIEILPSFLFIKETLILYELYGLNVDKLKENTLKYYKVDVKTLKDKTKPYTSVIEAGFKKIKDLKTLLEVAATQGKDENRSSNVEKETTNEVKGNGKPIIQTGREKPNLQTSQSKIVETKTDKSKTNQPQIDKPKTGQTKTKVPKTDKLTNEKKKGLPKTEVPKTGQSKMVQPKTDQLKPDQQK